MGRHIPRRPTERAGRTFQPAAMISCCSREMQSAMSSFAGRIQHGELGAAGSGRSPSHSITLLIPQRSWRVWSFQPFSGTRWNCTGATARSAGRATKRSILQRSRTLRREGAVGPVRCAFTFDLLTRKARVFVMPTRSGRGLAGRVSARGRGGGTIIEYVWSRARSSHTAHLGNCVCPDQA